MTEATYSQTKRISALRKLVKETGTQAEFARKYGLDASYISQILSGHRGFGERSARNFEKKIGLPHGYLDESIRSQGVLDSGNTEYVHQSRSRKKAPVISWVKAGSWSEAIDLYSPGNGESFEEVPDSAGPNTFWLKVVGDSMTSPVGMSVPEGYLIMVDPDIQPDNGCLVVAKLEDEQQATFKKLVIDGPNKYLKPLNPSYDAIRVNGNCLIVGVVTEIKYKL